MNFSPRSAEEVRDAVRSAQKLLPRGGGTKPALTPADAGALVLEMGEVAGIVEYEPAEYTITALAGTPVAEVQQALAAKGQYLPFDPLFVEGGATLGGTVAANTNGPGRFRYGGVRDFLLGIRFVDGMGELVRGGGKVVKNAAGFDLPKLVVGSMGQYGILVELTFKVFPEAPAYATIRADYEGLEEALGAMARLARAPSEIFAMELEPPGTLWLRVGGPGGIVMGQADALRALLGTGDVVDGATFWRDARALAGVPAGENLVKVPLAPRAIPRLEAALGSSPIRRYSAGGNIAWIGWPGDIEPLDRLLARQSLSGMVVRGQVPSPLIGRSLDNVFARRVKSALDPTGRFIDWLRPRGSRE